MERDREAGRFSSVVYWGAGFKNSKQFKNLKVVEFVGFLMDFNDFDQIFTDFY
jgi:hypothetical protein